MAKRTARVRKITKNALIISGGTIASILIGFGAVDFFRQREFSPVGMLVIGFIILSATLLFSRK